MTFSAATDQSGASNLWHWSSTWNSHLATTSFSRCTDAIVRPEINCWNSPTNVYWAADQGSRRVLIKQINLPATFDQIGTSVLLCHQQFPSVHRSNATAGWILDVASYIVCPHGHPAVLVIRMRVWRSTWLSSRSQAADAVLVVLLTTGSTARHEP